MNHPWMQPYCDSLTDGATDEYRADGEPIYIRYRVRGQVLFLTRGTLPPPGWRRWAAGHAFEMQHWLTEK